MSATEIDYPELVDQALRSVARRVLGRVAEEGLPGAHHFYISFATDHPDLSISPALRAAYPEEMTIVLQNQFWDLEVDEQGFAVMLRFAGEPQYLRVPWQALRSFVDPEAEFGLRFDTHEPQPEQTVDSETAPDQQARSGDVVSFEDFRKRDD